MVFRVSCKIIVLWTILGCHSNHKLFIDEEFYPCTFNKDSLTIIGSDASAPTIIEEDIYLIWAIGKLVNGKYRGADFLFDYWSDEREGEDVSYSISGCKDTTWAKNALLEEMKNQYYFDLKDTITEFYTYRVDYDGVTALNFEPCEGAIAKGMGYEHVMEPHNGKWREKTYFTLDCGSYRDIAYKFKYLYKERTTKSIIGTMPTDKYYTRVWHDPMPHEKEEYLNYMRDSFGLTHTIIDTAYLHQKLIINTGFPELDPTPFRYKIRRSRK